MQKKKKKTIRQIGTKEMLCQSVYAKLAGMTEPAKMATEARLVKITSKGKCSARQ